MSKKGTHLEGPRSPCQLAPGQVRDPTAEDQWALRAWGLDSWKYLMALEIVKMNTGGNLRS